MAGVGEEKYDASLIKFVKTVAKIGLYQLFPSKAHDDSRYYYSWLTLEGVNNVIFYGEKGFYCLIAD